MFFFPIGGRIARRYKPKVILACVAPIGFAGMLASSFMVNYWAWLALFSVSFGFCNGFLYILPMQVAWLHFPKRIGLAGGVVVSGFGFGAFFFNYICSALANPDDLKDVDGIYPKEVGDNVPAMI